MSAEKCGTYAGVMAHRYYGEPICDPCREAQRLAQRERRARGGPAIEEDAMRNRARHRAVWRLKDLHRAEFDLLVEDEIRVERMAARRREPAPTP